MTLAMTNAQPEALLAFADLLQSGFENPERISGRVQINCLGKAGAHPLGVVFGNTEVDIRFAWLDHPDATLTIPLDTVELIVDTITEVDFRDPDIIGALLLDGNLDLINHLAKALLRPSEDTAQRFELAQNLRTDAYSLTDVPRVSNPSELFILESLSKGQPLIITDLPLATNHPNWSLEQLETKYGEVPLRVRSAEQRETVAEFIARVRATGSVAHNIIEGHTKAYTEGCSLPEAMRQDFVPTYFTKDDYIEPQIWLGSVPVNVPASSLHHDPLDGFLYQIIGRKKLTLYAPNQAPHLYPMKAYNNYQPCWVSPEKPDFKTYPEFSKAKGIEVVLQPGELLIQPAGWFHAVYCLDSPTFSVSYFYRH